MTEREGKPVNTARSGTARQLLAGVAVALLLAPSVGSSNQGDRTSLPSVEGGAHEQACGAEPLDDCPLQAWMKANALAAINARDFGRLEKALIRMQSFAPPDYDGWRESAERGAAAAARRDLAGVRQVCRGCHESHRAHYRREYRPRPLR